MSNQTPKTLASLTSGLNLLAPYADHANGVWSNDNRSLIVSVRGSDIVPVDVVASLEDLGWEYGDVADDFDDETIRSSDLLDELYAQIEENGSEESTFLPGTVSYFSLIF